MIQNPVLEKLGELSENELRKKVIIPILERTEGVVQVTDVHGVNEKGLDVIFFSVHKIRRTCFGIQIKRGDISGGGSKDGTVKQILDQLELARGFKHPVAVQPAGQYSIEHFIVACNGRISQTARSEIAERIQPTPVDFWDISSIIGRARDVYPEILRVSDPEIHSYLKFVEARCQTLDALDQVAGVADRKLSEVFVDLSLRRRFDPGLADGTSDPPPLVSVASLDVASQSPRVVILGEQNEGKTAILRMLAIRKAQELLDGRAAEGEAAQIPVMIRTTEILREGTLRKAIGSALFRAGAKELADSIFEGEPLSPFLILIDGFSELHGSEEKTRCSQVVEGELANSESRAVLAARPDDFLRPGYFNEFQHYTIQDFDQTQVRALVHNWTKDSVEFGDVAEKMIDRIRDALQLPGSPIPAIIGVMLYEKENRFITNTAEAVDRYMVIRLGRYAQEMGIRIEVEWTRKQDLLAEVAYKMVEGEEDSIPYDRAVEMMDSAFDRWGEEPKSDVAIEELIDAGVLDLREGELSFYRTAFRDFFAAQHLRNQETTLEKVFKEKMFDRGWAQVLVFAAGLRRHNTDLLLGLNGLILSEKDQLTVTDSEDYLYGAYLLGRILSNSEAAEKPARLAVLRTSLQAATDSAEALSPEAERQFGNFGRVVSLIGAEHTLFAIVGVPWLEKQFMELAKDSSLPEDERYLVTSVYAHLGCKDWIQVLADAIEKAKDPRCIAALMILVHLMGLERRFSPGEGKQWKEIKKAVERKRKKFSAPLEEIVKLKGPALELERQRMRRLQKKHT